MPMRVCAAPRCPVLIPPGRSRCPAHTPDRGTTTQRGYGYRHRQRRAELQRELDAGKPITCWRCGTPILPGEPWDLGHDDDDRSITRGPEHANRCNRRAAGIKGQGMVKGDA